MNIKDFKWTEKRFGTTFANILKKLGGLSKDATDGSIEYKDDDGNVTKLVTDSNFSSLLAKNGLIEVKWQELKDKRDNGKLIPGSLYRITDYNCTTTQENTRSAGHQFDIVLLALSENKLAEEGWAMMHENVYDVTFSDGVTKKCYLYKPYGENDSGLDIVDINTLTGLFVATDRESIIINEENKTCICETIASNALISEGLSYNYFQNSNLSAWKVWYCLDNDTDRFSWADDSVDESTPATIEIIHSGGGIINAKTYTRDESLDVVKSNTQYYGWTVQGITPNNIYTTTETPAQKDNLFTLNGEDTMSSYSGNILSFTPAHEGTGLPNGRGVIYRLIDEWNNDVPYDFKNIQYVRPLTDGEYDPDNGTDTWVYTFSYWYNDGVIDSSTEGQTFTDDGGDIAHICENTIKARNQGGKYNLSNNVIYSAPDGEWYYGAKYINIDGNSNINTILSDSSISLNYTNQTIIESNGILLHECYATSFSGYATIYIDNKKVLTES